MLSTELASVYTQSYGFCATYTSLTHTAAALDPRSAKPTLAPLVRIPLGSPSLENPASPNLLHTSTEHDLDALTRLDEPLLERYRVSRLDSA